jgi:hypothetical protein
LSFKQTDGISVTDGDFEAAFDGEGDGCLAADTWIY